VEEKKSDDATQLEKDMDQYHNLNVIKNRDRD
jgi:hypothetical protein